MATAPIDESVVADLVRGAVDVHIHCLPDIVPRKMDALELAQEAAEAGMAAIVVKCHQAQTVDRAYMAQKVVPGVRVLGGIALNTAVGGLSPEAVDVHLRLGGKVVWMPTVSAAQHIKMAAHSPHIKSVGGGTRGLALSILDDSGRLRPEVTEILGLIKNADAVLFTGHISPAESLALLQAARTMGLERVMVNHPLIDITGMSLEDQRRAAALGAYVEHTFVSTTSYSQGLDPALIAEAIRAVGPAHAIMSTDLGQAATPPPVEGMREYIRMMLRAGFSEREVEAMVKTNPSRLLGLS